MACRNVCGRSEYKRISFRGRFYESGAKWCTVCQIFIKWDGNSKRCPCCKMPLRSGSHDNRLRQRQKEDLV